ncbi:MAG TPA: class I SAM-dependent methyltransferase [Tepidisphaeraceae bacterium]|nr:class I SAM-dependent methyltransferase [Tepidisphaeraceae bacterium]
MAYPNELVLRVNEIYHDVEEAEYQNRHPEIFEHEAARWRRIGERLVAGHTGPMRILDIGCGTGFVGLQLGGYLQSGDTLICADLSARMLEVCRRNIEAKRFDCECAYAKLDGVRLPLGDGTCEAVTMNSVLHHVPDFASFFSEIDRVLQVGGWLAIAHEPNRRFYQHPFLWANCRVSGMLFNPRQTVGALLRRVGLIDAARAVLRRFNREVSTHRRTVDEVNRRLLSEGRIEQPLTVDELTEIVDYHSPTAGGTHREKGIDVEETRQRYLPGFEIEILETYNHLGDQGSDRNALAKRYAAMLQRRFPQAGATLLVVMRKRGKFTNLHE